MDTERHPSPRSTASTSVGAAEPTVSELLPPGRRSVRTVRALVADLVQRSRWAGSVDDAILLASEVATNAALHARGAIRLSARVSGSVLRVEVTDEGAGRPRLRRPRSTDLGGRGLLVVDRLALRWGTETATGTGKTVWFEL